MKSYRQNRLKQGHIKVYNVYPGESIETKVARITQNKEPITDGAPLIYTERNNGVAPEYDIRTDRWEVAVEAMDKVHKANIAKRENKGETPIINIEDGKKQEDNGGPESVEGTK